jgi:hypothetical protein
MTMKFDVPRCPVCNELAKGTLESVPGMALLIFKQEGEAEYLGETEIFWKDQVTRFDRKGRVTLLCTNGHQWRSRRHDASKPKWSISQMMSQFQRPVWYNPLSRKETDVSPRRGRSPWPAGVQVSNQRSRRIFWKSHGRRYAARRRLTVPCNGHNWRCWSTIIPTGAGNGSVATWASRGGRSIAGGNAGRRATCPWTMSRAPAARPILPPRDHALVKALACERVAETGEPISRQPALPSAATLQHEKQALHVAASRDGFQRRREIRLLDEGLLAALPPPIKRKFWRTVYRFTPW